MGFSLRGLWEGADFWDKEENKRQQVARTQRKSQNPPPPAQTVKPSSNLGRGRFKVDDETLKRQIATDPNVRFNVFKTAIAERNNNQVDTDLQKLYKSAVLQRNLDKLRAGEINQKQYEVGNQAALFNTFDKAMSLEDAMKQKMGFWESAAQGAGSTLMELSPQRLLGAGSEFIGTQLGNEGLRDFGAKLNQPFREYNQFIGQNADNTGRLVGSVAGSILSAPLAPSAKGLGVGLKAGNTMKALPGAIPTAFRAGRYGLPSASDTAFAIREGGGSENAQRLGSISTGLVSGLAGTVGAEGMLGVKPTSMGITTSLVNAAKFEGIEEIGEGFVDNLVAQKTYDPNRSLNEGLLEAGLAGAAGGVAGGVAFRGGNFVANRYGGTEGKANFEQDVIKTKQKTPNISNAQIKQDPEWKRLDDNITKSLERASKSKGKQKTEYLREAKEYQRLRNQRRDDITQGGYIQIGENGKEIQKDIDLFHGSDKAKQIFKEGFKPTKNSNGQIYGNGVYLATDDIAGKIYGGPNGEFVSAKLDKNAKILKIEDTKSLFTQDTNFGDPKMITDKYKKLGYDGLQIGNNDSSEVVVFNPEKISVTAVGDNKSLFGESGFEKKTGSQFVKDFKNKQSLETVGKEPSLKTKVEELESLAKQQKKNANKVDKLRSLAVDEVTGKPSSSKQDFLKASDLSLKNKQSLETTGPEPSITYDPNNPDGNKQTNLKFLNTAKESIATDPELKSRIKNKKSNTITNKQSLETAKQKVSKQGFEKAVQQAKTSTTPTREIQSKSLELIERLQTEGRYDDAIEVMEAFAERARKAGQAVQIAAAYDRLTPEGALRAAQREINNYNKQFENKPNKQKKLTPAQAKKIKDLATEVQNLSGDEKLIKQAELMDEIRKVAPTSTAKKAYTLWKAGLLTGVKGGVFGNAIGNTTMKTMSVLSDVPASAFDTVLAKFTGQRSKGFTLKGIVSGFGEGTKIGAKNFKQGIGEEDLSRKLDYTKTFYSDSKLGKAAQLYTDKVFQFYSSADKPFYYAALRNNLNERAKVEAKNKGLKGESKRKFIDDFIKSPPTEQNVDAVNDALTNVFQNKNKLGDLLSGIKNSQPEGSLGRGIAEVILPFTGVPSNVATAVVNYTPLAGAKNIYDAVISSNKGNFDQRQQRKLAESIGKSVTGTGIMWLGYALAKSGALTGAYPEDNDERALWEREGKQPWSIKIGGKWRSLNYTGPVLSLLSVGAFVADDKSVPAAAFEAGKGVIESSPLQGVQGALDALNNPEYYGERFIQNTAGSVIPTFIKDVSNATDPKIRDYKQSENPLENLITNPIKSRLPGLNRSLPEKTDRFGNTIDRSQNSPESVLDPTRPIKERQDNLTSELRRLYDGDNTRNITPTKINGKAWGDENMSKKRLEEIKVRVGQELQAKWSEAVQSSLYKNLPTDNDKYDYLQDLKNGITRSARNQFNEMSPEQQNKWLKSEPQLSQTTKDLYDVFTRKDLPSLPQNEKALEYIRKYTAKVNSGELSDIDRVQAEKSVLKDVYKSELSDKVLDFYNLTSDSSMRTVIQEGKLTRQEIDQVMELDNLLTSLGLQTYPQIGKTLRAELGYAPITEKTSKGSSKRSGGSKKKTSKYDYSILYSGSGGKSVSSITKSLRDLLEEAVLKG